MAFVKLDTGILNSTLWVARECREVFITSLLMAEPREFTAPQEQIEVRSLALTGFAAPPGWYGFVEAAGIGIIRRAMVDQEAGLCALEKLGATDPESRSKDFDGRRLIRVDGGYLVLNFMKYRDRDYTGALRAQRYRDRKKAESESSKINAQTPESRGDTVTSHRDITQAEAEAEIEKKNTPPAARVPPACAGSASKDLTAKDLEAEGVDKKVARDWLRIRKAKKAPLTETAWEGVKREAASVGMTPAQAVKHAAESGWQGFKASWLQRQGGTQPINDIFAGAR